MDGVMDCDNALELLAGKYLTFQLGDEVYGLGILKVQEIIGMMLVTCIPRTPIYIRGVINLRGKVIPVVELRKTFELKTIEDTEKTCIIVIQVSTGESAMTMGLLVDEVSEVLDIAAEQLEDAPQFGTSVNTDFIMGIGKVDDKVVMLLDVNKVLNTQELTAVTEPTET